MLVPRVPRRGGYCARLPVALSVLWVVTSLGSVRSWCRRLGVRGLLVVRIPSFPPEWSGPAPGAAGLPGSGGLPPRFGLCPVRCGVAELQFGEAPAFPSLAAAFVSAAHGAHEHSLIVATQIPIPGTGGTNS